MVSRASRFIPLPFVALFILGLGAYPAFAHSGLRKGVRQATTRAPSREARAAKSRSSVSAAQPKRQWEEMGLYFTRSLDTIEKAYYS